MRPFGALSPTLLAHARNRQRWHRYILSGGVGNGGYPASVGSSGPARPVGRRRRASQRRGDGKVFISYRREDSAYAAGWLYDRLRERLGSGAIFKDIDNLRAGDDFVAEIVAAVQSSRVVLALIGKDWAMARDAAGARRLDDPDDFVRVELETALERGVRIIPVLVMGARMPAIDELPASLAPVVHRHALELSSGRFDGDVGGILDAVQASLTDAPGRGGPGSIWADR